MGNLPQLMCGGDCSICMEPMRGVNPNISMKFWALLKRSGRFNRKIQCEKLKCGHQFHSSCISEWFLKIDNESSGNCPLCREKIRFSNKLGMTNRKMYTQKEYKEDMESFEEDRPTWYRADSDYSDSDYSDSESDDEGYESAEEQIDDVVEEEAYNSEDDEDYDSGFDDDYDSEDDDDFENERPMLSDGSSRIVAQSLIDHYMRNAIPPQDQRRRPIRPGIPYRQRVCYGSENFDDYRISAVFDRSYHLTVYRILDNTKFTLRSKLVMDGVYNKIAVRGKKKYMVSRQGQDFGCALA